MGSGLETLIRAGWSALHITSTSCLPSEQAAQGMTPWSWTMFPSNLDKPFKLDATFSPCRTIMLWLCVVRANTARARSIPLEHTGVDCSVTSSASQTRTQVASILVGEINSFCLSDDKQGSMPRIY